MCAECSAFRLSSADDTTRNLVAHTVNTMHAGGCNNVAWHMHGIKSPAHNATLPGRVRWTVCTCAATGSRHLACSCGIPGLKDGGRRTTSNSTAHTLTHHSPIGALLLAHTQLLFAPHLRCSAAAIKVFSCSCVDGITVKTHLHFEPWVLRVPSRLQQEGMVNCWQQGRSHAHVSCVRWSKIQG